MKKGELDTKLNRYRVRLIFRRCGQCCASGLPASQNRSTCFVGTASIGQRRFMPVGHELATIVLH